MGQITEIKDNLTHAAERKAMDVLLTKLVKDLKKGEQEDRTAVYLRLADLAEKFFKGKIPDGVMDRVRQGILDPEDRWFTYIDRIIA